jgi:hypothetical protein
MGATNVTVGKATAKANAHALSQIETIFSTSPTLKILMTNDMMHDMSSAIKKANTMFWYFPGIIFNALKALIKVVSEYI